MIPQMLVCSGLDPTGDAGLLADYQAAAAQGVIMHGMVTALTAQNHLRVTLISPVSVDILRTQWQALQMQGRPQVVKVGMTGNTETLGWILSEAERFNLPLVLDPVHASTSGHGFVDDSWRNTLLSGAGQVDLLTPNLDELEWLLQESPKSLDRAARSLMRLGFQRVLVKGGHGNSHWSEDRLYEQGELKASWQYARLPGQFRGTGCRLASAIAARRALGEEWPVAIERAGLWLHEAMMRVQAVEEGSNLYRFLP